MIKSPEEERMQNCMYGAYSPRRTHSPHSTVVQKSLGGRGVGSGPAWFKLVLSKGQPYL